MPTKKLSVRTIMEDQKSGLGDDFDPNAMYKLVFKSSVPVDANIVAECKDGDDGAGSDMVLVKIGEKNVSSIV